MSWRECQGLSKWWRPLTMWKGHLIDGRNRMAACIDLSIDWHAHLCELDSDEDPVAYVISHNLHRRHLGPGQKAMVADKIRAYYDQQAKQRMSDGGKSAGKGRKKQGPEKLPDPKNGDSRDAAGAAVGVSGRLVDAARTVRRLGSAALIESVESGKVSVEAQRVIDRLRALIRKQREQWELENGIVIEPEPTPGER
jgi:hypothetical protein